MPSLKRPAQPEEIAPAFVHLASEVDSNYFTGEVLTLPGGETTAGQILLVCREMRARSVSNV